MDTDVDFRVLQEENCPAHLRQQIKPMSCREPRGLSTLVEPRLRAVLRAPNFYKHCDSGVNFYPVE